MGRSRNTYINENSDFSTIPKAISTKISIYQREFLFINENEVDINKTQLSTKSITPTTSSSQKN